jgi:hypothetical protein
MVPNSRLFHKIILTVFSVVGCTSDKGSPPHKCQAIVVVDKTNSVSFINRLPILKGKLRRDIESTYASAEKDILISQLVITGSTRVFPDPNYFGKDCPDDDLDSRPGQIARQKWNSEKRKWISDEVQQVVSLIQSPCNSNTTDIFSIFNGIQQAQKWNGPWDSVNVFSFSDMINTSSPINLLTDITINNAHEKGKAVCQNLIDHGQISSGNNENLYLTIYTPDKMEKTALVNQFWRGFFEQWGLQDTHYHFE